MASTAPIHPPHPGTANAGSGSGKTRSILGIVNFAAGTAVMMIEISGNRLIAPAFGNSIYTWTALIGVVLVAFSVGNWLGGKLADKSKSPKSIAPPLIGAGLLTALIPVLGPATLPMFQDAGLISGPILLSALLFLAPGILLGMVSPMCVRWHSRADGDQSVGGSVGFLGMLGSLGSVTGTLATGFYLLPSLGVRTLLFGSAILLCVLGLLPFILEGRGKDGAGRSLGAAAVCAGLWAVSGNLEAAQVDGAKVVYSHDTFYHKIRVVEREYPGGRIGRFLMLDSTLEGGMDVKTGELLTEYQRYWELLKLDPTFQPRRALFLGAGAFGMPERVSAHWPELKVDVAEIDPAVVTVGRDWFFLDEYPNVNAVADDARRFLNRERGTYDFVFADAYNGKSYIPPHLLTKEFFELVKTKLDENGVLMMNVISALNGPRAELGEGVMRTLKEVFPHVRTYAHAPAGVAQNVIFMAGSKPLDRFDGEKFYLPGSVEAKLTGARQPDTAFQSNKAPLFTDDHNSVEAILARQLRMAPNP